MLTYIVATGSEPGMIMTCPLVWIPCAAAACGTNIWIGDIARFNGLAHACEMKLLAMSDPGGSCLDYLNEPFARRSGGPRIR